MNLLFIIALLMAYTVNPKIYHWEAALNVAACSHSIASGFADPAKQRDNKELVTPRLEFRSTFSGFGPNEVPHYWLHPDKSRWPDTRDGMLYAKVVTARGDKGQDHDSWVGTARSIFQSCSALSGRMQFHKVESILEDASAIDLKTDEHHDITVLSFKVRMRILFDTLANQIFVTV